MWLSSQQRQNVGEPLEAKQKEFLNTEPLLLLKQLLFMDTYHMKNSAPPKWQWHALVYTWTEKVQTAEDVMVAKWKMRIPQLIYLQTVHVVYFIAY